MKTKKILFFLFVSLLSIGSISAQPTTPPNPDDVEESGAPIDGQIWLGLLGGLAIGGYFFIKKRAIKID
jgi:hypothetical protein